MLPTLDYKSKDDSHVPYMILFTVGANLDELQNTYTASKTISCMSMMELVGNPGKKKGDKGKGILPLLKMGQLFFCP